MLVEYGPTLGCNPLGQSIKTRASILPTAETATATNNEVTLSSDGNVRLSECSVLPRPSVRFRPKADTALVARRRARDRPIDLPIPAQSPNQQFHATPLYPAFSSQLASHDETESTMRQGAAADS